MKKSIVVTVLMAVLPGCGRDYPEETRFTFMANCTVSASGEYCKCALEGIEDEYEIGEFLRIEQDIQNGSPLPARMREIMLGCRVK